MLFYLKYYKTIRSLHLREGSEHYYGFLQILSLILFCVYRTQHIDEEYL